MFYFILLSITKQHCLLENSLIEQLKVVFLNCFLLLATFNSLSLSVLALMSYLAAAVGDQEEYSQFSRTPN